MVATFYSRAYRCDECKSCHCTCHRRTPDEQRAWVLSEGWEERGEVQAEQRWLKDCYLDGANPQDLACESYYV